MRARGAILVALVSAGVGAGAGLLAHQTGLGTPLEASAFATGAPAPAFDPLAFFEGRVVSTGVVETPAGLPTERVETESTGARDGEALVVSQELRFGGGERQTRRWRLTRSGANGYAVEISDGRGTGETHGELLRLVSTISLKPGNPLYDVTFDQWMRMGPDGTMVNRTRVLKAGLVVAFVTEHFRKVPPGS